MKSYPLEERADGHLASGPEKSVPAFVSWLGHIAGSVRVWWVICLGCAGILALFSRHEMSPDGLSYIDMASEALRSGPSALVNGLWSPGYPALLSLAFALFRPAPRLEFPLVHFVNFLIFALDLWAFHFFLRQWQLYGDTFRPAGDGEKRNILPFAFCTFLLFTLQEGGVAAVHPDLCMAAAVFLIAGITCRLSLPGAGRKHYVALGFACGLGYYAKSPMLLLSLILLGGLLLYPPSHRVSRQNLLLALAVFLLTAAPLVALLSERAGHFTFGESGKLNYAWHVNGLQPYAGWTGADTGQPFSSLAVYGLRPPAASARDSHRYGIPEHPPRRLMETPLILEFGAPIQGTFPLWYDPAYWYAGAKVHFDLRQQIAELKDTLLEYQKIFSQRMAFFAGALVLFVLAERIQKQRANDLRAAWLWIWPLIALLMYTFVHVEIRYIAAFCVLLCLAVYGTLMARVNRQVALAVGATVAAAMMIPFAIYMAETGVATVSSLVRSTQPEYESAALGLRNLGMQSGDRLAVVGFPLDPYYAHYDGLRVVASIPATDEFWNLPAPDLKSVAASLSKIGVKAVIARNRPRNAAPANWKDLKVPGAAYSVLLLSEPLAKDSLN